MASQPHAHSRTASADRPAPTITQYDRSRGQVWYDYSARRRRERDDKPPYRVPSMAEIAALPKNGLTVVSTFSGCGGSCLGFEMAGYTVLYASEFIPAAQETYRANHPGVFLDSRDIRQVKPEEILERIGRERGDVDVLEGSPPCAAFQHGRKRSEGWGEVRHYSDTKQRVDDLFWEFARLLDGVQPRAFVAENVSGLVKGVAKGYFKEILAALKACGYRVEARLLDAQWLGVPQARQRIIFVGVRNDLAARGVRPAFPAPLTYRYSVRDALPWIDGVVQERVYDEAARVVTDGLGPSVTTRGIGAAPIERSYVVGVEQAAGFFGHQARRLDAPMGAVLAGRPVCVVSERVERDGPSLDGTAIGAEWEKLAPGEKSERYYNLKRTPIDGPSQTVTAMGGSSAGVAAVTHPTEKRKFTLAELRRIGSFPDDFILTGTYAQGWERIGRAVPPVMMRAVAVALRDETFAAIRSLTP